MTETRHDLHMKPRHLRTALLGAVVTLCATIPFAYVIGYSVGATIP